MFKVLLTGFKPFAPYTINPTEQLVEALQPMKDIHIEKEIFEVDFELVHQVYPRMLEDVQPDLIINLGLNGQANSIQLERFAVNSGFDYNGKRTFFDIDAKSPAAYRSNIELDMLSQKLNDAGVPAIVSNHAGSYLCNFIYYHSLQYADLHRKKALFVHIPFTTELVCDFAKNNQPTYPSLPQSYIDKAIRLILHQEFLVMHVQ
ncbi:MAG: pyroglutamyl-peptidase I [Aureispira sp.]|nr:pyroglutamyl-peptidase I [Aureispira sp.]